MNNHAVRRSLTKALCFAISASLALAGFPVSNAVAQAPDCSAIEQQLVRDQNAMRRQQDSIMKGNRELEDWAKQNEEAQKAALDEAKKFLRDSVTKGVEDFATAKIAKLRSELMRRQPQGQTVSRYMEKIREFEAARNRLAAARDAAKIADKGYTPYDAWQEIRKWAAERKRDVDIMNAFLKDMRQDPATAQIAKEVFGDVAIDVLKLGLDGVVDSSLSLGDFLVKYGYEATKWTASRNRIVQQNELRDQDLRAVDALDRQIKRTVARLQECRAKPPVQQAKPQPPAPQPSPPVAAAPAPAASAGGALLGAVGIAAAVGLAAAAASGLGGGGSSSSGLKSCSAGQFCRTSAGKEGCCPSGGFIQLCQNTSGCADIAPFTGGTCPGEGKIINCCGGAVDCGINAR